MELTIYHKLILEVMDKSGIALSTNLVATKAHSNHVTVKKNLLELEKEGMVERIEKKWKLKEEAK
ncbi:hypothetical protein LCGC14_1976340 [marine sediment metagenome]|uniref:HTH dtxR-type domain-containing protein n=1 Tax=marine sediment metagenome TaxID=412755 RepID=A0A0F9FYF9_9ZZZZ